MRQSVLCVCVKGERLYWVGGGVRMGTSGKLLKGSRDNGAPFTRQQRRLSHASLLPLLLLADLLMAPLDFFAMKALPEKAPFPLLHPPALTLGEGRGWVVGAKQSKA